MNNNTTNHEEEQQSVRYRLAVANYMCRAKAYVESDPAVFFTAMVALRLLDTARITREIPTFAVSASGLEINPDFVNTLEGPQWNFVLLHEALHIRNNHLQRMMGKHQMISNIAADLSINSRIDKWTSIKTKNSAKWPYDQLIKRPDDGCFAGEGKFADLPVGLCMEDYYKLLVQKLQQQSKQQQQQQSGQGQRQQQNQQGQGQGQQQNQQCQGQQQQQQSGQGQQQNQQGQQDQGQQQGQQGQPGQGSGMGDDVDISGLTPEQIQDMIDQMNSTGMIDTDVDDPAKMSTLNEMLKTLVEKAAQDGNSMIDKFDQQQQESGKKIGGGLTKQMLDDYLNGAADADEAKGHKISNNSKPKSMQSGSSKRGVDGIVDRADDENMWRDILDPLRAEVLTDERRFNHRRAVQMSIADSLSHDFGRNVFLRGRIMGHSVGGEVLMIVDTSGSTGDYWMLSIAKALECINSIPGSKISCRVVVFSDSDPSINDEYVFYNGEEMDEDEIPRASVIEDGKDLIDSHLIDVSPWLLATTVDIKLLVGSTITGGGGTAILPVVNKLKHVLGQDVTERFIVTVIITDAALYGDDVAWSRSPDVTDTFGEHVAWLFLDLYNEDYGSITGEKKYLITCR